MPTLAGFDSVVPLLAAAAEVDAEFLLAFGDSVDLDALGPLPANARTIGWTPLYPLLTGCAAVVHHGGSGTTLTALATGVPQLVLPHAAEQLVNADVVAAHGLGLRREPGTVDAATLTELLADGPFRSAAKAAADLVRAQPDPATLVPRLEELASSARTPVSTRG
jgi:UDP:flavonoid glycosyltransferase YjiC (YdhE family)